MTSMAGQKLGFALLGVGRIGQIHLPNLLANPRVSLRWIVEENVDLARQVMEKYDLQDTVQLTNTENLCTVLADASVSAVLVCTPTDTHTELTRQALKAGKNVLCEKPISEELQDVVNCYNDADKYSCVLMACFNRHFDSNFRDMYQRTKKGHLGKLHLIRATFRDCPRWFGAKSLTQTFLIHDIDMICWFAGGLPDSVVCVASTNRMEYADKDQLDTVVVTMRFADGLIGILDFSRFSSYGYDIRLEVLGDDGMLLSDSRTQNDVKTYTLEGRRDAPLSTSFPDRFRDAYKDELNHFIDVCSGNAQLEIKREFSERAAIVCEAIRKSHETGTIVHLKDQ